MQSLSKLEPTTKKKKLFTHYAEDGYETYKILCIFYPK